MSDSNKQHNKMAEPIAAAPPKHQEKIPMNNHVTPTTTLVFVQPAPASADIKAVATTLGMLAGEINEGDWMVVRLAIKNLISAAAQVEMMERNFPVPRGGEM